MKLIAPIRSVGVKELNETIAQINQAFRELRLPKDQIETTQSADTLIYDKTIGKDIADQTNIVIDNLDGNTHGGYLFEFYINGNVTAAATWSVFFNDKITASEYRRRRIWVPNDGTVTSDAASDNYLISLASAGDYAFCQGVIHFADNKVSLIEQINALAGADYMHMINGVFYTLYLDNLTSISIKCGTANGMRAGSRLRLWRMK